MGILFRFTFEKLFFACKTRESSTRRLRLMASSGALDLHGSCMFMIASVMRCRKRRSKRNRLGLLHIEPGASIELGTVAFFEEQMTLYCDRISSLWSMSDTEGALTSVDVSAILARAQKVSIDLDALAKHSFSLLSETSAASLSEAEFTPVAPGAADAEDRMFNFEEILYRFKAVQSALNSIQESDAFHASAGTIESNIPSVMGMQAANDVLATCSSEPKSPSVMGMKAVSDLRDICSNPLQAFVSAAAQVSLDLIPQASCIQQAVEQQAALFDLLYLQGAALSDARVVEALENISCAIRACSVDPLSVSPSLSPHVSMLSGAASGINWIATTGTPKEQITDTLNAVPVFGKRIMERGANHMALVDSLQRLLRRMLQHVIQFHPSQVVWDCSSAGLDQSQQLTLLRKGDNALRHDANKIFQSDLNFAQLYHTYIQESVEPWLATGIHMDEMVQRQMKLCEMAFKEQQKVLLSAMMHKQPKNEEEWGQALGHLNMLLDAIEDMSNQRGESCIDKMRMCGHEYHIFF